MKKCRQGLDRKKARALFRARRQNAKRRRWWAAVIVAPLKAKGRNLRRLRRARLATVLGW